MSASWSSLCGRCGRTENPLCASEAARQLDSDCGGKAFGQLGAQLEPPSCARTQKDRETPDFYCDPAEISYYPTGDRLMP